jgi:peptidoglycan-associated lipoprotein
LDLRTAKDKQDKNQKGRVLGMISDIVARRNVLTFSLVASILFILQGCIATRDWVAEQLSPRDKRVAEAEGRLDKTDSRLSGTEGRLSNAEGRIGQVDAKAEKALTSLGNLRLERRLVLDLKEGANFGFNSASLPQQAKKEIDGFLSDLKGDLAGTDSAMFLVAGHTDNAGADDYNYELGRKRAESVAKYLILQKKVDPMRVVTVSYGKSAPIVENNSREARGKNRRVEILVYKEAVTPASTPAASPGSVSKAEGSQDRATR